uniref:Uncharacterized protein n=1 Tax=Rhizophora mucronata TaxID=61149 RepID=A0A2P2NP79_RHIMU
MEIMEKMEREEGGKRDLNENDMNCMIKISPFPIFYLILYDLYHNLHKKIYNIFL